MSLMPFFTPGGSGIQPGSFVFTGSSHIQHTPLSSTSPARTAGTWSFWVKCASGINQGLFIGFASGLSYSLAASVDDGRLTFNTRAGGITQASTTNLALLSGGNVWQHYVLRVDTAQGATANRFRWYRNNTLFADTVFSGALNSLHRFVVNGNTLRFGTGDFSSLFLTGKMAFIDFVDNSSPDPTAFGFQDGANWTRKPFAGAFGDYGFSLDGVNGFTDVGPNGLHFSGVSMTEAANIDYSDLPPYTT
jgi:hypothetical protein